MINSDDMKVGHRYFIERQNPIYYLANIFAISWHVNANGPEDLLPLEE
jgi:hypothetical protein